MYQGWTVVLYNCALPEMGQWGPKHVAVGALKHYCSSSEVCAFVGHTVAIRCCLQPLQTECDVYLNTFLMESSFVARVDVASMR